MERTMLAIILLVTLGQLGKSEVVPGSSQMGVAYNLAYYASSQGVDISKPPVFQSAPDSKDTCVGYSVSSDISCNEINTGIAEGYKVFSSQSQSEAVHREISVGVSVACFNATTSNAYDSSYWHTTNYATTSAYGEYYSYELDFSWEKRGLKQSFLDDLNSNMETCAIAAKYGYYYLVAGYYGGSYQYSQSQSYVAVNSSAEMETSISTSFAGFTSSVEFGQSSTGSSTNAHSEYRFTYNGCDYQCLRAGSGCTWTQSCRDNPSLFAFSTNAASLIDIATLLRGYGKPRADEAEACVDEYLASLGIEEFGHVQLTSEKHVAEVSSSGPFPYSFYPGDPQNCPVLDYNKILTDITFVYAYKATNPEWGAAITGLTCVYSLLDVPNPGSASTFETVFSTGGSSTQGGTGTVKSYLPPNTAIVGVEALSSSDCSYSYGIRLYYAELSLNTFSPPYVGTLDFGRFVDVMWLPGYPSHVCDKYYAPANTTLAGLGTKSVAVVVAPGESNNLFNVTFHGMARSATNSTS